MECLSKVLFQNGKKIGSKSGLIPDLTTLYIVVYISSTYTNECHEQSKELTTADEHAKTKYKNTEVAEEIRQDTGGTYAGGSGEGRKRERQRQRETHTEGREREREKECVRVREREMKMPRVLSSSEPKRLQCLRSGKRIFASPLEHNAWKL